MSHVTFTPPQVYHSNVWYSWDYGNPACSPSYIGSSSSVEVSALKISFSSIVQYFVAKIEQTEKYSKNFESIFLLIQKYLEINTNCFGISLYFHYLCINI